VLDWTPLIGAAIGGLEAVSGVACFPRSRQAMHRYARASDHNVPIGYKNTSSSKRKRRAGADFLSIYWSSKKTDEESPARQSAHSQKVCYHFH
jgi:hypothetical protein